MNIGILLLSAVAILSFSVVNVSSESLESDSVSAEQVSETVKSETVPTEQLEQVTGAQDQVSNTIEQTNADATKEINNEDLPKKPLGVSEAEGKVIGEE